MIAAHRHSLRAAWANTRATTTRNPDTGEPRPLTLQRRLIAAIGAVMWVATPGVTIETWHDHASGRITSIRTSRLVIGSALAAAASLVIAAKATVTSVWFYVCVALLMVLILPLVVSVHVVVSARKFPKDVTHILTDLVRHPNAPAGSGARLIEALASDPSRVIGAEAHNDHLWTKVYAPHADRVGTSSDGKTRFELRCRAIELVEWPADLLHPQPPDAAPNPRGRNSTGCYESGVHIRPRHRADLAALELIARSVRSADGYPPYLPDDNYLGFLDSPEALGAWVAVDGSHVVGHISLHSRSSSEVMAVAKEMLGVEAGRIGVIARLLVDPGSRRKGIAQALVEHAQLDALDRGLNPILDVVDQFTPAIALYERQGWTRLGTVTVSLPTGSTMNEHIYSGPAQRPTRENEMSLVTIRLACADDVDGCVEIMESLPDYFTEAANQEVASNLLDNVSFVAEHRQQLIGLVMIERRYPRSAEILVAAVRPEHRDAGVGSSLLDAALTALAESGVALVEAKTLDASDDYEPYVATRAFWERRGFVQIDCIDPLPGWDPGNPSAIYVKALATT